MAERLSDATVADARAVLKAGVVRRDGVPVGVRASAASGADAGAEAEEGLNYGECFVRDFVV
ncbi:MAG: hypothetical protein WD336_09630, partial [Trueperaceae bacterium]